MEEKCRERYSEERRILRKAMLDKKLVVFVGSGTSLDAGMPSWENAIKKIASRLNISEENMDYMKIPQFYYNSRGKKEYVELMREIFHYNDELEIKDVHRNIIKLNTHTIITTNYDCLLEKAAAENAEFIQVISQDRDLPYRTAEKELVKMHGDFSHVNFVLREDDYLHYSENFKLIEAYVKSLIATNVVLFIGYSFNDPDVKQIFSWVKDILEEDFQRAYMLEVCKEFDPHEHDYYKHLGINVIYASEMYGDFNKDNASLYTNDFLKYILEEDRSEDQIDVLFERCHFFSNLNYISRKYINSIFRGFGIAIEQNELKPISSELEDAQNLLSAIFINRENCKDEKISFIKDTLSKSAIKEVVLYKCKEKNTILAEREVVSVTENFTLEIAHAIEQFDFDKLKETRTNNEIKLTEQNPELYLEQAYISYLLHDYAKAYRYLRICSKLFYQKKQYVWYFISEFNRKNIGRLIENDFWGKYGENEKEKIMDEVNALNLEIAYSKIPLETQESKDFLQDLYTFRNYYSLFQKTYLTSKKTETEAKTNYSIYAGIPGYQKLRDEIKDCYNFDLCNYIMIDRYQEDVEIYRLFARTIILSACSIDMLDENIDENIPFSSGNIFPSHLEKFDVYIILRYMQKGELKTILHENCSDVINISEETTIYLENIVKNISKIENNRCDYFWVYLTLAGYIQLTPKMVAETTQAIVELLNDYYVRVYRGEIIHFMWQADKQNIFQCVDCLDNLKLLIEKIIDGVYHKDASRIYKELLKQCLSIFKNNQKPYSSETLLTLASSEEYSILGEIYHFCDDVTKEKIRDSIKNWKWDKQNQQLDIYENIVLNDILEPNENIENDVLTTLDELKEKSQGVYPNQYSQVIGSLTNLYLSEKVCNKEKVKEAIGLSDISMFKWIIEADNFDYDNFNISWLNICSDKLLETLALQENARREISLKIKEANLNGNVSKDILNIYFKFFAII